MKKFTTLLIISLLSFCLSYAQTGEVRGVVFDKTTGEPLIGVSVIVKETSQGAATDLNGFFTINKIEVGNYNIQATYLGYDTIRLKVKVEKGSILSKTIYLTEVVLDVGEVVVSAEKQEKKTKTNVATTKLTQKNLQQLVTVGGEPDLVQSLQILPGVTTTGDQGGQLFIRGGSPIMNKVLLDGMTIYNPFHSIGLFSVFDSDIIRNADVYSAAFIFVVDNKALKADPREPKLTAHPCPMDGMTTAAIGLNPNPIRRGAVTATGTPKPPAPCKNEAKTQPIRIACIPLSLVR